MPLTKELSAGMEYPAKSFQCVSCRGFKITSSSFAKLSRGFTDLYCRHIMFFEIFVMLPFICSESHSEQERFVETFVQNEIRK